MIYSFEATAKKIGNKKELGVWTDGVMLSTDQKWACEFELKEGKKYKITVEQIDFRKECSVECKDSDMKDFDCDNCDFKPPF